MGINMAISSTAMGHQTTSKVISHMISALCLKKFSSSVLLLIIGHLAWLLASQNLKGHAIKCRSEFPHLPARAQQQRLMCFSISSCAV